MSQDLAFIEVQFPVSKISKESYKERKANLGQTLTGLGKWWGRKPLILVRSSILGLLMPASDDPVKDRDIFMKILTMDSSGLWLRRVKALKDNTVIENLNFRELKEYCEVPADLFSPESDQNLLIKKAYKSETSALKWKKGLSKDSKDRATRLAFDRLGYDEKLEYVARPEEVQLTNEAEWASINKHLGTNAFSLIELIRQLGEKKYGRNAIVGDSFSGGGSIPFEAARMGCEVFANDLNPIAGLLTWSDLNIAGASDDVIENLKKFQEKVYTAVQEQINEWGVERNEHGHRANAYLYCAQTNCPECGYSIPLSPTWIIGKGSMTIALLEENDTMGFDILIKTGVEQEEMEAADKMATIKNGDVYCPHCKNVIPMAVIRKDRRTEEGVVNFGIRQWELSDFCPKETDIFKERLFCVRYEYEEEYRDKGGNLKIKTIRYYTTPSNEDLRREDKVVALVASQIKDWQKQGFVPDSNIEEGEKTIELFRTRGWRYWHQLFNPRQLLIHATFMKQICLLAESKLELALGILGFHKNIDYGCKLNHWNSSVGNEKPEQTFYNQALNTLYVYGCRTLTTLSNSWFLTINNTELSGSETEVTLNDARALTKECDLWITDPPYADAVNYHELSEYFLAWDKALLKKAFPEWYIDSKRVLAVKGTGTGFNQSMVEIYTNLANHMPDNGMQIVMFTHQSPAVWADLTLILWSAGLHVTAAWNIATETESGGLKDGNYVKGTVLLVLRKRISEESAFTDEITYAIQEEVKRQIDSMRNLEDKEDPNFSDADYLLAAYAATLKVLTGYGKIGDIDIERELNKPRDAKSVSPVESIINNAIRTAYDYLIPQAFDSYIWRNLSPEERFFIKGMELEKSNVYQLGAYQEMARGFGVKEFKNILASTKANQVRFKTPLELGNRWLRGTDAFSNTLLRQVLMAIAQSEKEQNGQAGRIWLKNEVADYWEMRVTILELLRYLSTLEHIDHMQHWESPAKYAKYLVELVGNDGV